MEPAGGGAGAGRGDRFGQRAADAALQTGDAQRGLERERHPLSQQAGRDDRRLRRLGVAGRVAGVEKHHDGLGGAQPLDRDRQHRDQENDGERRERVDERHLDVQGVQHRELERHQRRDVGDADGEGAEMAAEAGIEQHLEDRAVEPARARGDQHDVEQEPGPRDRHQDLRGVRDPIRDGEAPGREEQQREHVGPHTSRTVAAPRMIDVPAVRWTK